MGASYVNKELLKRIFNKMSGAIKEEDELVPEYAIKGQGYGWYYDPTHKSVTRVAKGIKCYVLSDEEDELGRILVYTASNDVILIEQEELIYTGFD